ncbi:hypothetical protein GPECTOR_77g36 [Gonium pectorale]|uniref:DNA (cytosine-5-)-methyltransferase n=1 Tax=Gonium pectorale TaxID=33097 RepID=A0A150G3Q5_GONPE|nr:hypothetical protein GPECTOR_77g36 [Gonium pectorale]|eukprot:KXZ43940.1 hypothetical protein GPECTOR_77g36 [Gonium pectorale]
MRATAAKGSRMKSKPADAPATAKGEDAKGTKRPAEDASAVSEPSEAQPAAPKGKAPKGGPGAGKAAAPGAGPASDDAAAPAKKAKLPKATKPGAASAEPSADATPAAGAATGEAEGGKKGKGRKVAGGKSAAGEDQTAAEGAGDAVAIAAAAGGKPTAKRGVKRAAAAAPDSAPSAEGDAGAAPAEGDGAAAAGNGGSGATRRDPGLVRKAAKKVASYKGAEADGEEDADNDEEMVDVESEAEADGEEEALRLTASGSAATPASGTVVRCLVNYSVTDGAGRPEPLDRLGATGGGLFVTGLVYPAGWLGGPGARVRGGKDGKDGQEGRPAGVRVTRLGPLTEWRVRYSPGREPQLVLLTAAAQYEAGRPAGSYKKVGEPLAEQLELAGVVHAALCPAAGGRHDATFDDVCYKLARTKSKLSSKLLGARGALRLNGRFLLEQLAVMSAEAQSAAATVTADKGKGAAAKGKGAAAAGAPGAAAACSYEEGPFARGLREAMNEETLPMALLGAGGGGGIRINADGGAGAGGQGSEGDGAAAAGGGGGSGEMDADMEMARRLQVRPEEIADDYPPPAEYKSAAGGGEGEEEEEEQEEWDELLLVPEDEVGIDIDDFDEVPEVLPTLNNFAFYNAEGLLTSLELVPMRAVIDGAGCAVFASGEIGEDPEEAEQGGNEAGGSGAGGSGSGAGGSGSGSAGGSGAQRYFLTQIKGWFLECGPDGVVINVRTQVAWYRLKRPSPQYARWHRVVQRAAAVGVKLLSWLEAEERPSRLSFADLVARLAALGPDDPAFISAKLEAVQRFVEVHGQVLLRVLANHWLAPVRECAFAKALRGRLADRRCRQLRAAATAAGTKKAGGRRGGGAAGGGKGDNDREAAVENPVKLRQQKKSGRPVAMPATATTMIHRIWSAYHNAPNAAVEAAGQGSTTEPEQEQGQGSEAAAAGGSSGGDAAAAAAVVAATPAADGGRKARLGPQEWKLEERGATDNSTGRTLYGAAVCGDMRLVPGSVIRFETLRSADGEGEDSEDVASGSDSEADVTAAQAPGADGADAAARAAVRRVEELTRGSFGLVQCIYSEKDGLGSPMVQIRRMVHGRSTMLDDVADPGELFLLDPTPPPAVPPSRGGAPPPAAAASAQGCVQTLRLGVDGKGAASDPAKWGVAVELLETVSLLRGEDHASRAANAKADLERSAANERRMAAGQRPVFAYRSVYCPRQAMFRTADPRSMRLGSFVEVPSAPPALAMLPDGSGFIRQGVTYRVGDFVYLRAAALDGDDSDTEPADSEGEEEEEEDGNEEGGAKAKGAARRRGPQRRGKSKAKGARAKKAKEEDEEEDDEQAEEEEEAELESEGTAGSDAEAAADGKPAKAKGRKRTTHKGSNAGLRAFAVAQLLAVESEPGRAGAGKDGSSAVPSLPKSVKVRRFYRPEDISEDLAYRSDYWELYAPATPATPSVAKGGGGAYGGGEGSARVPVGDVFGRCNVVVGRPRPSSPRVDTFQVVGTYDPRVSPPATGPPPASLELPAQPAAAATAAAVPAAKGRKSGGGSKTADATAAAAAAAAQQPVATAEAEEGEDDGAVSELFKLPSMDIFAGCGGLSEGFHQAGVADSRWAIEYDHEAAEAFRLNNPDAKVFCNNCNVLLQAAMLKAGAGADCVAHPTCSEAVERLDEWSRSNLPAPGEVGLMMGGPPCQGYSGMNRFNRGSWSQVQNSMVMGYVSWCDFYRPRYFLLENVRNFAAYNGGRVLRLVVRSLLAMGYQVRFGILNAGNFGVPQSRKRTFVWAAQPGEQLPDWPTPRHVFVSSQLGVRLAGADECAAAAGGAAASGAAAAGGGDAFFFAGGPPLPGAPLRTVTVRDAIYDLPPIDNESKAEVLPYTGPPVSAFQRSVRGAAGGEIRDHMVKQMNELNLERCRCIPVGQPGADWRVLQQIVATDPSRELYKGQPLVPWCLPNTAARHNGWRGLFGRLDPAGHFPTATTDPNPMGKVGQVFHPTQHRIVSVRECGRAQVGNAVPPPLACALGKQLLRALKERRARAAEEAEEELRAARARRQQQRQQKQQAAAVTAT